MGFGRCDVDCSATTVQLLAHYSNCLRHCPPSAELPCLRLESICFLGLDVGSDQELLDLVHARRARDGIQRLTSVRIDFPHAQQVDVMPALSAAGLTVTLCYPDAQSLWFMKPTTRMSTGGRTSAEAMCYAQDKCAEPDPDEPDDEWHPISRGWLADYEDWDEASETD